MALIENDQLESVPKRWHVDAGAIEGGHRDGLHIVSVVSDNTGIIAEAIEDSPLPLIHEIANRGDDERATTLIGHDAQCDFGFAGSGRHDDDTLASHGPRVHGCYLFCSKRWQLDLGPHNRLPLRNPIKRSIRIHVENTANGRIVDGIGSP